MNLSGHGRSGDGRHQLRPANELGRLTVQAGRSARLATATLPALRPRLLCLTISTEVMIGTIGVASARSGSQNLWTGWLD